MARISVTALPNSNFVPILPHSMQPTLQTSPRSAFSRYNEEEKRPKHSSNYDYLFSRKEHLRMPKNGFIQKSKTFSTYTELLKPEPRYLPVNNTHVNLTNSGYNTDSDITAITSIPHEPKRGREQAPTLAHQINNQTVQEINEKDWKANKSHKETLPRFYNFKRILQHFQNASDRVVQKYSSRDMRNRRRTVVVNSLSLQNDNIPRTKIAEQHDMSQIVYVDDDAGFDDRQIINNLSVKGCESQSPRPVTISYSSTKKEIRKTVPLEWTKSKQECSDSSSVSKSSTPPPSPPQILLKRNSSLEKRRLQERSHKLMKNRMNGVQLRANLRNNYAREHMRPYSEATDCRAIHMLFVDPRSKSPTFKTTYKSTQSASTSPITICGSNLRLAALPISNTENELKSQINESICASSSNIFSCMQAKRSSSNIHLARNEIATPSSRPPSTPTMNRLSDTIPDEELSKDDQYNQLNLKQRELLLFVKENLQENRQLSSLFKEARMNEFNLRSFSPPLIKGNIVFYDSVFSRINYDDEETTLMVTPVGQYFPLSINRYNSSAIWNPPSLAELKPSLIEAKNFREPSFVTNRANSIFVLPRLKLYSIQSFAVRNLEKVVELVIYEKQVCFIMLQLVSILKALQLDGIELLSNNFSEILVSFRNSSRSRIQSRTHWPRLILLYNILIERLESPTEYSLGLCKYALRVLCTLLQIRLDALRPSDAIKKRTIYSNALLKCAEFLDENRSSSLTEAKNALEFGLWFDYETSINSEMEAKTWLDSTRANFISDLVTDLICGEDSVDVAQCKLHAQFLYSAHASQILLLYKQLQTKSK